MSADRWSVCPNCLKERENEYAELEQRLTDSYGKVPADEYFALAHRLREPQEELEETLRQDYEFFLRPDGVLEINFSCSCDACGLQWNYSNKVPVDFSQRIEQ